MKSFKLPITAAAAALVAAVGAHAAVPTYLMGDVVDPMSAARTIDIKADTRWVNVTEGETVKFVENGHEFAIHFDGTAASFDLNALAPAGSLDHKVVAYVAASDEDR